MKTALFIFILICLGNGLKAQYTYTIKADSVKITNCDSAELIIENHTQGVPGFLFNTGRGRTIFQRGAIKISDSTYIIGGDTLLIKTPAGYFFATGLTNNSNTITSNLSTGITGGQSVTGGTAANDTLRLRSTLNAVKGLITVGNSYYDEGNDFLKINSNNIGSSIPLNSGIYLANNTPAQAGGNPFQQYSPELTFEGQGYNNTSGTSHFVKFRNYLVTQQSNPVKGYLAFEGTTGAGAFQDGMYLTTPNSSSGISYLGVGTSNPSSILHLYDLFPTLTISNGTSGISMINFTNSALTPMAQLSVLQRQGPPGLAETRLSSALGMLTLYTNGSERLRADSLGNIGIGTISPHTILEAKGWIMTSPTSGGLSVGPSAYTSGVPVNGLPNIYASGSVATYTAGSGRGFAHNFMTNGFSRLLIVDSSVLFGAGAIYQNQSGNVTPVNVVSSFLPGGGNASYSAISVSTQISQTLGANGITRGLFINPILTSVADFRAIEVARGKSILNGNVSINTIASPTAELLIGAGTAAAGTSPIKLTAGTVLTNPEDGAIEYDGTDYYITQGTSRYKLSKTLTGQLTTDFGAPSVAAGNMASTTLSVPGVAVGDVVAVNANSGAVNPPSIMITAYVAAANTVAIRAYNAGGSAVTLASDTYSVRVIK